MIKKKSQISMSFNWLFAIIVGGVILFLAIYASGKFIKTSEKSINTETGALLLSMFDPLETGLASGKSAQIQFRRDTKMEFSCNELDNLPFGTQKVSFTDKTFGDEYGDEGEDIKIKNKYIFVESVLEVPKKKNLTVYSKPFFFPFKVADVIIMNAKNYCFYKAPEEVKEEIQSLNIAHIQFENKSFENCEGDIVCFESNSRICDIKIYGEDDNYEFGYLFKDDEKIYYVNDLLYGAIFSSPEIYECNLKRLINKQRELAIIYQGKSIIIERKKCSTQIALNLDKMIVNAEKYKNSKDLLILKDISEEVELVNRGIKSGCEVF